MSEKKKSNISPKLQEVVKGIFFILLATMLALNVGKVGRTLVFPLIYLFGASYYLILLFLVLDGLHRIIFKRKIHIKYVLSVIGVIVFSIGFFFTVGSGLFVRSGLDYASGIGNNINNFHALLGNYYQNGFLNLFATPSYWSNGLLGILLGSIIGNNAVVLALGIIFLIIGFILAWLRPTIDFVRKFTDKHKAKEIAKRLAEEESKEEQPEEIVPIYTPEPKEETMEVPFGYEVEEDISLTDDDFSRNNFSLDNPYTSKNDNTKDISEFSRLSFENNNVAPIKEELETPKVGPIESQSHEETLYQEVENEDIDDPSIPHFEDVYLDEMVQEPIKEEEPVHKLDGSLLTQKPVFEEPKPIPQPAAFMVETPIEVVPEVKKKERVEWVPPSTELLKTYEVTEAIEANSKAAEERVIAINNVLNNFGVGAKCVSYTIGSSVTRYNIEYEPNVSMRNVEKLVNDIALRLGGLNVRFSPIVEGQPYSGLEIPNIKITTVSFKEVVESLPDAKKHPLAVGFGKNISGDIVSADFDDFPHLLVAGTTGSGKSIYTHSIISTLIMRTSPDDLKIVLVDPKRVEMTKYREMPHLLCPIITEASQAKVMLSKLVDEMNDRYQKFADADECSNIKQFNEYAREHNVDTLPYILVVIDEYADLVDNCKEISQPVVSIAQKARAAGIHMLISTQRPSTNIITGVIKGNLPTHVALMTSSAVDSVTIIGEGGAEKLLGRGDMLVQSPLVSRIGATRLQGCFVDNREIARIVGYLKEHYPTNYDEKFMDLVDHSKEVAVAKVASGEVEKEADAAEENKYQSIKEWVMSQQFVSMSKIQRECGVGFNRAGRFFNRLQKEGIVSTEQDGTTKGCKVLVRDEYSEYNQMVTSDELTKY